MDVDDISSITVTFEELVAQRPWSPTDDVHFCESLAEVFIEAHSRPGDVVLDPFAGFGTTLAVAARLGRRAIGMEILTDHAEIARDRVGADATILVGDVRDLLAQIPTDVGLCLTSPPYMTATHHPENPLTGYTTLDAEYHRYIDELVMIFCEISARLVPEGRLVINVADPVDEHGVTPLVDDLSAALSGHLTLRSTVAVAWDEMPPGIANDTCLVFSRDQ